MRAEFEFFASRILKNHFVGWLVAIYLTPALVHAQPVVERLDAARIRLDATLGIERFIDEVVARHAESWPREGVVVELPAGYWHLSHSLRLDAKRSGRNAAPLILRGQRDGSTVLSGAVRLRSLANIPNEIRRRLSPQVSAAIRAFRLPNEYPELLPTLKDRQGQGLPPLPSGGEPFYSGKPLQWAQWPNSAPAQIAWASTDQTRFDTAQNSERWRAWVTASDIWVHGYWGQDWADEWIPAVAKETEVGILTFRGGAPKYGLRERASFRVFNVLEELDESGEWFADAEHGIILIWPPSGQMDQVPLISRLETVIDISAASHIRLEDLQIEGARGDAVVVSGGQDVVLERTTIRHVGLRAVRFSGFNHRLIDSDVRDTGQGAVVLSGGDRKTLRPAQLVANGNRFSNFNRWVRTYRPAVLINGVGNEARANLIDGGPHTGLMFYGNEHRIAENVFLNLAQETGDVGAVYTGMDWTARGTVIRHNVLQDIRGPGLHGSRGIYLDDQASGITVQGNVFVRVDQAVFLGGGKDNLVDGNLFVASTPAIHLDDRGLTWQRNQTLAPDGLLRRRLDEVPWRGPAYARYPGLSALMEGDPGLPSGNVARRNAVVAGESLHFQGGAKAMLQVDRVFDAGELRFTSGSPPPSRDYGQLEPALDSPAVRDGFPLLPWDRMRCTRARWQGVPPGGVPRDEVPECRSARR